jgi:predicted NUDIX family NTP pyrophosphohydrolase
VTFRSHVKPRFSPDYGRVMTTDKSGRISAGLLLWRRNRGELEVLLAHMGGPFWVKKDHGHWTIPKGEIEPGEEAHAVALREFAEETGQAPPVGPFIQVGEIRQKSGKRVLAWAVEGDLDPAVAQSNTYEMEWPPRSGRIESFPEIDRVEWFGMDEARRRLKAAQVPFLDRLEERLNAG